MAAAPSTQATLHISHHSIKIINIMRILYFAASLTTFALVSARALSPLEKIAHLAHFGRRDDNATTEQVLLNFSGCDGKSTRTGKTLKEEITTAWDEVIKIAQSITDIDMSKDTAAIDCKYNQRGLSKKNLFKQWH